MFLYFHSPLNSETAISAGWDLTSPLATLKNARVPELRPSEAKAESIHLSTPFTLSSRDELFGNNLCPPHAKSPN